MKLLNVLISKSRNIATIHETAVELVDSIPNIARRIAEIIVSEIVTDMIRCPTRTALDPEP